MCLSKSSEDAPQATCDGKSPGHKPRTPPRNTTEQRIFSSSPSIRRASASIGMRARHRASARDGPSPSLIHHLTSIHLNPTCLLPHLICRPHHPDYHPRPRSLRTFSTISCARHSTCNVRRPGYAMSPVTPQDRAPNWPKIVHLGPTSAFRTSSRPLTFTWIGLEKVQSRREFPSRLFDTLAFDCYPVRTTLPGDIQADSRSTGVSGV
jgi:hypothetical protein